VKVWDTQTGEKLLALPTGNVDGSLSMDGRRFAGSSFLVEREGGIKANIWDLLTGEKLLTIPNIGKSAGGGISLFFHSVRTPIDWSSLVEAKFAAYRTPTSRLGLFPAGPPAMSNARRCRRARRLNGLVD
jgi:hypothetical protein